VESEKLWIAGGLGQMTIPLRPTASRVNSNNNAPEISRTNSCGIMASDKQVATSLLTEHLRYTPLTLIDDIINNVNELANKAVDAVEGGLLRANASNLGFASRAAAENRVPEKDEDGNAIYPELRAEIEEGSHKLETLIEANIDKNFDKFEILALRGILSVPQELVSWMRLTHYDVCSPLWRHIIYN
jgi:kinetochore protein Mis12/MTW1